MLAETINALNTHQFDHKQNTYNENKNNNSNTNTKRERK